MQRISEHNRVSMQLDNSTTNSIGAEEYVVSRATAHLCRCAWYCLVCDDMYSCGAVAAAHGGQRNTDMVPSVLFGTMRSIDRHPLLLHHLLLHLCALHHHLCSVMLQAGAIS